MYLFSERLIGVPISVSEKAFCYFGSYLLSFFLLEHQIRTRMSPPTAARALLSAYLIATTVILCQIRHFGSFHKPARVRKWVWTFAAAAVISMGFVVVQYLKSASPGS